MLSETFDTVGDTRLGKGLLPNNFLVIVKGYSPAVYSPNDGSCHCVPSFERKVRDHASLCLGPLGGMPVKGELCPLPERSVSRVAGALPPDLGLVLVLVI